jgi:hypothetical protein
MKEMMLRVGFAVAVVMSFVSAHAAPPPTVPIFSDNFESGTMAAWTTTGTNPLEPNTNRNIVPAGGMWSAYMNTSIDRMHHNIIADNGGVELGTPSLFTSYIYDPGNTAPATRIFNEVRSYSGAGLPNGGTTADGALVQLLAIGKYNTVDLPGETFTSSKYQARTGFTTNATIRWFNLNGPGSPNRSVGWHRFDIERHGGGIICFYVDGILSRTVSNAVAATWDTVVLGPGLGSTVGDAWIDGISVGRVDFPPQINCPSNIVVQATSSAGAVVNYTVTARDDTDTNVTVVCNPPSGSTFPIGTTTVTCTATDDAGNMSRCSFTVTVRPPTRFEGFQHYAQGQAMISQQEGRLVLDNLGSSGQDGVDIDLFEVDAAQLLFVPFDYLVETCIVSRVEIEVDGAPALLQTELLLGQSSAGLRADFGALGSTESEVEVRGHNGELLQKYLVPNGQVIDVEALFPPPCIRPTVVYSYFQGTNLVWWRFCKPECGPCIGTNCWIERVVCLRAITPELHQIELMSMQLRVATPGHKSIDVIDLKFMTFGNEHHLVGDALVDATKGLLSLNEIVGPSDLEIRPIDPFNRRGVHGIHIESLPVDLVGVIVPCGVQASAVGMVDGLPFVEMGMASLRGGKKAAQLSADFQAIGGTMVELQVWSGGQQVGKATLPNGVLGDVNGDGRLTHVSAALVPPIGMSEPAGVAAAGSPGGVGYRFVWDAAMDIGLADGSMFKGTEFRMSPTDPKSQATGLEMFRVILDNLDDGFTIVGETVDSGNEVFFPQPVFPPPTATWGSLRQGWDTYGGGGGGAGGQIGLRGQQRAFFDVFTELPAVGETRRVESGVIVEADLSMDGGASSECVAFRGQVVYQITGGPVQGDTRFFDIETLSMNLGVPMRPLRLRESPTRASLGRLSVRQLPGGGYMMDSFFDVFTEISMDGGQTWVPGDAAWLMELLGYDVGPFAAPNLPPAMGSYAMQCPPVDYVNQVIIRNLALLNLSEGPPLDQIPIGGSQTVEFQGGCSFEHSRDGGMTWRPEMADCRATFVISHVLEYEGGNHYYDTEMLQMDLRGGTLPPAVMIRESPTRQSTGRTCLGENDSGQHLIGSFFDVFTELTLDGGQTFAPATRPARLTLTHGANDCLTIRCPPDQQAWTCSQGTVVNYPSPTATSACGSTPIIDCRPPSGSFFPVGSTTVDCRASDAAGNQAFCSFKVVVIEDSAGPRIVCPQSNIVVWACSASGTVVDYGVTATDDCDTNVTIMCNPPAGTVLLPGMHTVTCVATDDCEKRDQCQFVVDVREDTGPPVINCPSNIVVWTCNPDGTKVDYVVTATDDCDPNPEIRCQPIPPGGNFPPGTTTVTCTAIDDCNKSSSCTFTVTVRVDQTAPVLNCPTNIVAWTCSPNGTTVDYTVTATDDCDPNPTIECMPPSGSNFPPGVHTVRCRAIDECQHVSFCDFTVTVRQDTEAPKITCPPNMTNCVCSADGGPINYPPPTVTDDCDTNVTVVCTPPSGTVLPPGAHVVHCVATDDCGNRDECRFFVFMNEDKEPPRIVCPNDIVTWTCDDRGTGVPYTVTATDDCDPNVTVTCTPPPNSVFPPGTHTVTCVAEDDCGNKAECSFRVTVVLDTTPPEIKCPTNIFVWTCNPEGEKVDYRVEARDDCDTNVTVTCTPPSGSFFPVGMTTVTCVAEDDCGRKAECTFVVTVQRDTEAPKLECRDMLVCTCSPNGTNVTYNVTATDDCDTNVTVVCTPPSGSPFPPGTNTVTCTARDDCGNTSDCSFNVIVVVNTVSITCPPDMKVNTCSNSAVVNYDVTVTEACQRDPDGTRCVAPDNGTGTAQLPAQCPYGSSERMHIIDGLPPGSTVEIAPLFHNFVCSPTAPSPPACPSDCYVQDDCDPRNGEIVLYESMARLELEGTGMFSAYRRTLIIPHFLEKNQHGPRNPGDPVQSFGNEKLQLFGQLPPGDPDFDLLRITAGGDFGLPSPGGATLTRLPSGDWKVDSFFDITYRIDFVGRPGGPFSGMSGSTTGTIRIHNNPAAPSGPTVVCNPPSGSSFPIGTTTVTCRATNECGFSDSCRFQVTVEGDQEPPRIVCPNGIQEWTCTNGAVVNYTVTATDDTDTNVTIVCNPPSGSVFPVGTTIVTCTATDDCGRTDRCEFPVRVIKDSGPPVLTCSSNIVVWTCDTAGDQTRAKVDYVVTATDDCDTNVTIVCNPPSGSDFLEGLTPVDCVATDDCGNRAECRFFVTVRVDREAPQLNCPTNMFVWTCSPNGMVVNYTVTATDDCDTNVTIVCTPPSGSTFAPGSTSVHCVATDDCGNRAECRFFVVVRVDTQAPQLQCPSNMVFWTCSPNGMVVNYTVTATDDCDTNVMILCDPPSGSFFPPGSRLVHCIARDDCGNGDECRFFVEVRVDTQAPRLDCPTNIVVWTCDQEGQRVDYTVRATDDCDTNVTVTCTPPSGSVFPPGTHTVTCVAEDDCGHKSECSFLVRVILDRTPPEIRCPSNIVVKTCFDCEPVEFRAEARDDCDTNVTIVCNPPSGTCFPVGTNDVTCIARDDCGNRSECKFQIVVMKMPPPRLTIRRAAGFNGFIICWPYPSTGFRLQCAPRLHSPADWVTVTNAPVQNGDQWCVTLPNEGRHRFYRLCKPPRPTITGVHPANPGPNDIVFIDGSGFGNNPDDLCVAILAQPSDPADPWIWAGLSDIPTSALYPLRAIFASDTFMTARMPGALPPDAQPGHLMVGHGTGQHGRFTPIFDDIHVIDDVWTWTKGDSDAMGNEPVQPQPAPPPPNECWFFSGEPRDGQLCVFLDPNCPWPSNAIVAITARAHDSVTGAGGHDLDGPTIRFVGGGTVRDCAERIADVIRCAFLQQAGVMIEVSVDEIPGTPGVKITVRIPGGYIDRGFLQICVRGGNDPVIESVEPTQAKQGDLVTIRGQNFGHNAENLCVVVVDGGPAGGLPTGPGRRLIPLQALQASGDQIIARMGPVPPNSQAARHNQIMVAKGVGALARFRPAFFDIFVGDDVWTWRKNGEGAGATVVPFFPIPDPPPPPSNCWIYSDAPVDGRLCVFLTPDCPWPSNAYVTIIARAHDSTTGMGADLAGPNIRFIGGGTPLECAERLADVLRCAFLQQSGVTVHVQVEPTTDGRVKITVTIPGGHLDRGMLTICVGPTPTNPAGGP